MHPRGSASPICPQFSVYTSPPVFFGGPISHLMAVWRAMVWLPGGTETLPPTLGRLRSEFPPSHQSHHICIACSPCCLRAMPASGPWVPSSVGSPDLILSLPSPKERAQKVQPGKAVPCQGLSRGPFQSIFFPSPILVLFSIFPLKNSVFSCRTGWTPLRKSRSRSEVSGLLWVGMWRKGGQGLQATGAEVVLLPSTSGSAFRPMSSCAPYGRL